MVLALVTSGVWADNWTVSGNIKLTEDMTVEALIVDSGVTLNLNGYKLTCTSIDGSGTITSTNTDQTKQGELYLDVASGSKEWPSSINFSGNVMVVKDGEGTLSSTGELNMNGATFVINKGILESKGTLRIAQSGTVNVFVNDGGELRVGGILCIGCGTGTATLTVNGGKVYSTQDLRVGNDYKDKKGTGILTINSGSVEVNPNGTYHMQLASSGYGILNLNGGKMITKGIGRGSDGVTSTFNFDGGMLEANGVMSRGLIATSVSAVNVLSEGGTINANGKSIVINKSLAGNGAIVFTGGGTIRFSNTEAATANTVDATIEQNTTLEVAGEKSIGIKNILNHGTILKTGNGTALLPFDNNSTGVTQINAGTVKVTSVANANKTTYDFVTFDNPDANQLVYVKGNATFDVNGKGGLHVSVALAEGANFVNTGSALGWLMSQTVQLIIEGNAAITAEGGDFGLIQPNDDKKGTCLDLEANTTLTLNGSKSFRLKGTTINGSGTIEVKGGKLIIVSDFPSVGKDCTLFVDSGTTLQLGDRTSLTVNDFKNDGSVIVGNGESFLKVIGTLSSGNDIPYLKLGDGATIKVSGANNVQTVSGTFSAGNDVTIDVSEIEAQYLRGAVDNRIPVLNIPLNSFKDEFMNWNLDGTRGIMLRLRWEDGKDGRKTLYVRRSGGAIIIVR